MKIKKIAALCAQSKRVIIFDKNREDGEVDHQWISDGFACYPIFDLPYLEPDDIATIFDIPEKNKDKYTFRHDGIPESYAFGDTFPGENMLEKPEYEIVAAGHILMPLQTQQGIVFIDSKYLSPLSGTEDTLELYERITSSGSTYIAAKCGLMISAIIMPYRIISKDFVEKMEDIARMSRIALDNNKFVKPGDDM